MPPLEALTRIFILFLEVVRNNGSRLSVLSYNQPITKANAIGVRRTIRSRSFKGYLKEEERNVRAAERNEIVTILEACTNCRGSGADLTDIGTGIPHR